MKKGISLVALVITIIVLIILTGAVVLMGINSPKSAQLAVFYNNVGTVQEAVTMKIMNNTVEYVGEEEIELYKWVGVVSGYTTTQASNKTTPEFNDKTIKGISVEKLDSSLKANMNISDSEFEKYYVDNKGIVYHEGFRYEGNTYYNKNESTVEQGGSTTEGGSTEGGTVILPGNMSTVTLTPNGNSVASEIQSTTIQITNAESVKYKYGWSTSNTVAPTMWTESTNKSQIVSKESGSGNYYLWITEVEDNTGNNLIPITNAGKVYVVSEAFIMQDANIPFTVTAKSATQIYVEVVKDMIPGQTPTYSYSKDDGVTWTSAVSTAYYTFEELLPSTAYSIKVKVTAGSTTQISESVIVTTNEIVRGTSTPTGWKQASLNSSTTYVGEVINGTMYYAPIPKGFVASEATRENTISGGLVIYEGSTPVTNENVASSKTQYNQFVWVPVNNTYNITPVETSLAYWTARAEGVGTAGSGYNEPYSRTEGWTKVEWDAMYESVMRYGGFYIGRYEAGKISDVELVVKQGQTVWNNIAWGGETTGAAGLARMMYRNAEAYGVTSTLIYGIQWDSMMYWANCASEAGKHGLGATGSVDNDKYNNVYDLRSNCREFTMEAYGTSNRANRGGNYNNANAVSYRGNNNASDSYSSISFRSALYVN